MKFHVTTARIHGLNDDPYLFEHCLFYAWSITFSDSQFYSLFDLNYIKVGNTEEEAKEFCNFLKQNFKKANIKDTDKVVILYGKDFDIEAIAHIEENFNVSSISSLEELCWIHVKDKFAVKSFNELKLPITSLAVI